MIPTESELNAKMLERMATAVPTGHRPKPLYLSNGWMESGDANTTEIAHHLAEVNRRWSVRPDQPIMPYRRWIGKFVASVKKIIRRSISWYVAGAFQSQTEYNASATRLFNALTPTLIATHQKLGSLEQRYAEQSAWLDGALQEVTTAVHDLTTQAVHAGEALAEACAARDLLRAELTQARAEIAALHEDSLRVHETLANLGRSTLECTQAIKRLDEWSPDWPLRHPEVFDYKAFQDRFRGTEDAISGRQSGYIADLRDMDGTVVDLGCGRGELLRLCQQNGIPAIGVDIDIQNISRLRAEGFDVRDADVLDFLQGCGPDEFPAILLLQVIEHLPFGQTMAVILEAHRVLKPGGKLIIETVNPYSLFVFAHALFLDPSHLRPVHPLLLQFCVESMGFDRAQLRFLSPVEDDEKLQPDPASASSAHNVDLLNQFLFGPQDYSIVGTKGVRA